ncbi:hypothetical protein NC652_017341 [Populus alba x Populus x berolinensis]|uniref:Uncharacterized protein n=1 Tax=Populus alba x Populus x berolinensis TaxID=444605 RepID=A0AAD6QPX9_9ROSI|nr:hypothetical protein NC651_016738 [Populus alba x Populus x berolinensis]KAJ6923993.1 hypothetical protein NC652_017341 [Populus alba x Populus x berolinensis]KAJ6994356.1 hypothetical protein NC653_017244 [Populus alba x Populus x berolinensis]
MKPVPPLLKKEKRREVMHKATKQRRLIDWKTYIKNIKSPFFPKSLHVLSPLLDPGSLNRSTEIQTRH